MQNSGRVGHILCSQYLFFNGFSELSSLCICSLLGTLYLAFSEVLCVLYLILWLYSKYFRNYKVFRAGARPHSSLYHLTLCQALTRYLINTWSINLNWLNSQNQLPHQHLSSPEPLSITGRKNYIVEEFGGCKQSHSPDSFLSALRQYAFSFIAVAI